MLFALCGGVEEADSSSGEARYVYAGRGGVPISAEGAALLEAESGGLLFAHNGGKVLPMASTTKIMTAAIVIENLRLDMKFAVPEEAVGIEGSSVYLQVGEVFTVEELLYGLMLESGNDAAVALAIAVAGDVDCFVKLMNEKAAELGLKSTRFANPHGLTAEGHCTTAEELARIAAYAFTLPDFERISSTRSVKLVNEGHIDRYFYNHNRLLGGYSGMIGGKTGYTTAAGRCLVTAARRNGMTLVAVTLNDRADWDDHRAMLDYGFSAFKTVTVCKEGETTTVPVTDGRAAWVTGYIDETLKICIPTQSEIEKVFDIKAVCAPIKEGQTVGKLKIYSEGALIKEVPLKARSAVAKNKKWLFF